MRRLPPGRPLDKERVIAILLRGFDLNAESEAPPCEQVPDPHRTFLYVCVSTYDQAEYGTSLDGQRDLGTKFLILPRDSDVLRFVIAEACKRFGVAWPGEQTSAPPPESLPVPPAKLSPAKPSPTKRTKRRP